ncbi:MAG: VC0807 family protein [Chloroflexota bacterium]
MKPPPQPSPKPLGLRQLAIVGLSLAASTAFYYLLHRAGVSNLVALVVGAVPPILGATYKLVTQRRIDGLAVLVVTTVVVSIVLSVMSFGPRFLLAKDGLITGVAGAWFVGSVRGRRPAAFLFARPLLEGRKIFAAGSWDVVWDQEPGFRRIWRVASVMWGAGLLGDAAIRVVMAYTLPIDVVPGLGGALYPATFVVLQVVTNIYYHWAGLYRMLGARWLSRQPAHSSSDSTETARRPDAR